MTLLKNVYKAKIKTIADKIPDNTNRDSNTAPKAKIKVLKKKYLVLLTSLHAKINKVKNKILNTTKLATTIVFTAVENKIPNVSNLVKKTDNKTKINEIENKRLLIMITINVLLLKNLINLQQKILLQDLKKQI